MELKAVSKIEEEMKINKNNGYVQVVGTYLLICLRKHPEDAEKILANDKTILKSLDAMRREAEKSKMNNCAVLTNEAGFAVVSQYYNLSGGISKLEPAPKATEPAGFAINLDDLL